MKSRCTNRMTSTSLVCIGFLLILGSWGCSDSDSTGPAPSIDARGGTRDPDSTLAIDSSVTEGNGGIGGSIRLSSSAANITMLRTRPATTPRAANFVGTGMDVQPGQDLVVSGGFALDFLRVQAGGTLTLADNTLFEISGDVEIAGVIRTATSASSVDAFDLTINAGGIINITGIVDCSGASGSGEFEVNQTGAGGHGGEIFIGTLLSAPPAPQFFISGSVLANGGDTFTSDDEARPGLGGQIFLGTGGSMTMTGRVSAHGGFSHKSSFDGATGGEIELIAETGLEIGGLTEITASGGTTRGARAGTGGTILVEALGTVIMTDFVVDGSGGTTFATGGTAGTGGTVTISADAIDIDSVIVDASGGTAPGAVDTDSVFSLAGGVGGNGGAVKMAGFTALDIAADVVILADGGQSFNGAAAGGTGGDISVINLDETNLTVMDFSGTVSGSGGLDDVGSRAEGGTICERGAGTASRLTITGTSPFPIEPCQQIDFFVHDLTHFNRLLRLSN